MQNLDHADRMTPDAWTGPAGTARPAGTAGPTGPAGEAGPAGTAGPAGEAREPVSAAQRLDLTLHRLAAVVALLGWGVTLLAALDGPAYYPPASFAGASLALGVGVLWSLLDCRRPVQRRIGLKVFVATAVVLMGLQPFVLVSTEPPLYPPLVHVLAAAACLSPLAFGTRAGGVVAGWWGVAFGVVRAPETGTAQAVVEGALVAVTVAVCTAALHLVRKASAAVSAAAAAERSAAEAAARTAIRLRERERWDLVLHDLVLGALILASRVGEHNRTAAAQLAGDSLEALEAEEAFGVESLSALLDQQARRLGLDLSVDLKGDVHTSTWPRDAWEAVAGATTEALVNIARHSGEREALVQAVLEPHTASITISDHGRGFDPSAVDSARAGVRRGIVRRMQSVGGQASVTARPGLGVVVSISWSEGPSTVVAPADWDVRAFVPLAVLGFLLLGLHLAMGYRFLPPGATVAIGLAMLGLTALIWWLPRTSPWWPVPAVALLALPVVATASLGLGPPVDLRFWFAGATGPAVAGLSFKFRPWSGVGVVLGSLVGVAVAGSLAAGVTWPTMAARLVPAYAPPLAAAVGGALLCAALDGFSARINTDARLMSELQIEVDRREIRLAEIVRRQRALRESVIPMLRRVAGGAELDAGERARCQVMEQTARDQLVAPSLVAAPELAGAVLEARSRGVTVILAADDLVATGDRLETFRRLVLTVVRDLSAPDLVRAKWRPREVDLGTVVVVGARRAESELDRWRAAGHVDDTVVQLSRDDDNVLLELVRTDREH